MKTLTDEHKKKISLSLTGITRSKETRIKDSISKIGNLNPRWKGGVSIQEQNRRYRDSNKDKVNNATRLWKSKNHSRVIFYNSYRRSLKIKNGGSHTFEQWILIKAMNAYLCNYCGNMEPFIKLTQDHIIPISKGGSDDISNIQPLCSNCNNRKNAKIL